MSSHRLLRENRTSSAALIALSILNKMTSSSSDHLFFPKANRKVCLVIDPSLLAWFGSNLFCKKHLNKMLQSLI